MSLWKEGLYIFSKFNPLNTDTPLKRTRSMGPSYDCIGLMLFNVGASFDRPRRPDTVALREGICSYAGCYLLVLYVWLQSLSLFLISFSRNYRLERELKNRLWKIDYSQLGFDRRASNTSLASAIVNVSTTVELLCSEVLKKTSCLILCSSIRYILNSFYYLILHFEKFLNLQLTFAVCSKRDPTSLQYLQVTTSCNFETLSLILFNLLDLMNFATLSLHAERHAWSRRECTAYERRKQWW